MNILFVSEYFPPKIMGGGEINLFTIAKALVKQEHTVSVLTSAHPGLVQYERMEGIQVYRRLRTGKNPSKANSNLKRRLFFPSSVVAEVKQFVKEKNIDIIHFIGTSVIAAAKLKKLNIPLVATIESYHTLCPKGDRMYHGKEECAIVCSLKQFLPCQNDSEEIGKMKNSFYLKYNPPLLGSIYRYHKKLQKALHYCHLVSISEYVQQLLTAHGLKSIVIANAISLGQFSISEKTENSSSVARITYLGSLTHFKGAHILLEALKNFPKETPYFCNIYGEGPLKEKLEAMIKGNNLNAQIHLPVPSEKVSTIYENSDIVVVPSLWPEPFGRIPIEAMAYGKAVIGSNIGGIKETVNTDRGLIFTPGNAEELKTAIIEVIRNKERQAKLKIMGRKFVEENFADTIVAQKLLTFYTSITHSENL